MNKTLRNSLIIAAAVAVIGLTLAIIGFASGGMQSISIGTDGITLADDRKDTKSIDRTFTVITSMDISVEFRDVIVKEGDEFRIQSKGVGKKFQATDVKGKLVVNEQIEGGFNFNIFGFKNDNSDHADLIITYPASTSFDEIKIISDSGKVEIEGINANNAILEMAFGNINMANSTMTKLKVNADSGDVKLDDSEIKSLQYELSFGDLKAVNFTGQTIDGNSDSGGIDIQGTLTGPINMTSSFGDIKLVLAGNQDQHSFELETDFGDININGSKTNTGFTKLVDDRPLIRIINDSGNISIENK